VGLGGRWLVARESVERTRRLRVALGAMDDEGNPTPEEIAELYWGRNNGLAINHG
jgi:hypothetical protein